MPNSYISYYSVASVLDGTYATSTIDTSNLVSAIQTASPGDTYFDTTGEIGPVYVYYLHEDGRQKKKLVHNTTSHQVPVSWSPYARDGTWSKSSIKAFDKDGAVIILNRSNIGSGEDLYHRDGTTFLNYNSEPVFITAQYEEMYQSIDNGLTWPRDTTYSFPYDSGSDFYYWQPNTSACLNTLWVLGGWSSGSVSGLDSLVYSTDGISFYYANGSNLFTVVWGVATNGNIWVATGEGSNTLAYSYNGIDWTGLGSSLLTNVGYDVQWNGTMFVACGYSSGLTKYYTVYSYDGITWFGGMSSAVDLSNVTVLMWDGSKWYANTSYQSEPMADSTNGINWNLFNAINLNIAYPLSMAFNGSTYVMVGGPYGAFNNSIAYSYDASHWTNLGVSIFNGRVQKVVWDNGTFVAAGRDSNLGYQLAHSTNGIDWTGVSGVSTYDLYYVGAGKRLLS